MGATRSDFRSAPASYALSARLAEQLSQPRGRHDRRLHGARHCGGPIDEAGQRAAEQRARDGSTEGIAVVLKQVVPG